MKKLFLLLSAASISFGAGAQSIAKEGRENLPVAKEPVRQAVNMPVRSTTMNSSALKTTVTAPRWFIPFDVIDAISNNVLQTNTYIQPIWFDSTVKQRFSTGLSTINFCSVGQTIDPASNNGVLFKDPAYNGLMHVNTWDNYTVDSIVIAAQYRKKPARPTSIVDTLIISVAPSTQAWFWRKSTSAWAANYIPSDKDTLWGFSPAKVDSINRAAFSDVGDPVTGRKFWKVYLTDADRDTAANGSKEFKWAVPGGGLTIASGGRFAITVTFKSGDTWTKNVDSFNNFHYFAPITGEYADGAKMPYLYYDVINGKNVRDRNGSSLNFSTDTAFYAPTVVIEGTNTVSFRQEFHMIGAKISCASCWVVNVNNVNSIITKAGAYPNPAVTNVVIPFKLQQAADVNVTLTNTVGQVVKSQTVANTVENEVIFSTTDLANGVYIYTVEANGQRMTGRVVVAH
jgi:hypothetical protein